MERRSKGEGTVIEYQPGKWLSRLKINGKQNVFYGDSEKEVVKELNSFKKKVALGQTNSKRIPYTDFLDDWLAIKRLALKPQSYDRLESTVELHIKATIGFYNLDKIDSSIIQDAVINIKKKTMSYSSLKKIYDALNESMRYAQSKGFIAHNPVDLVVMPKQANMIQESLNESSLEILTDDEIRRFIDAANAKFKNGLPVYPNGNMFVFMLNTGVRVGECTALKWSDYNDKDKTIRIYSTIIQAKNAAGVKVVIDQKTVKTRSSERVLKINLQAIESLPVNKAGKYIFSTKEGKPLRERNIQNTLDSICERAGIPHKSTHVFRHTYASKLFDQGIDVKIVSELLGHSDVRTTYNKYITLIKRNNAKAMDAIDVMY